MIKKNIGMWNNLLCVHKDNDMSGIEYNGWTLSISSSSDVRKSDGNIKSVAIVFWRHHAHLIISIDINLLGADCRVK